MHCSCRKSWCVRVYRHCLDRKMRMKISPVNRENHGAAEWGPLPPCWDPPQWDFAVGPAEQGENAAGEHKILPAYHREHQRVGEDQQTHGSKCCECPGTRQDAQEIFCSLTAVWCITHTGKLQVTSQKPGPSTSSRLRPQFSSFAHVK